MKIIRWLANYSKVQIFVITGSNIQFVWRDNFETSKDVVHAYELNMYDRCLVCVFVSIGMIQTEIGQMNGQLWERLIHAVYKNRYRSYQKMVASPGDFGLEGFVLKDGIVIQCYCPDDELPRNELNTKQVNKITKDLNKLSQYQTEIKQRLGDTKITQWIFVTPKIGKNSINAHARKKEKEIASLNLDIIDDDFMILVEDIDDYLREIREVQLAEGTKIDLLNNVETSVPEPELTTDYDKNISEKNEARCVVNGIYRHDRHEEVNNKTKKDFIHGYEILRELNKHSPDLYALICKLVNQYEVDVAEDSATWDDTPRALLEKIKNELLSRLEKDSYVSSAIEYSNLNEIVNHMVARWIAHCPLRIE
ncbi:hypothetical protein [Vibrio splendidus]|jgi:hypothetical protein|uniref:hypothetical protein n=1 Tax=Vibrio splendidus TaxID=29497 RepID=UPI003CE58674